jgi:hypothetical protein
MLISGASITPVFDPAVNVSNDGNIARFPNVQTNGNSVFVTWTEESHGIFFRAYSIVSQTWTPLLASPALHFSVKGGTANYPLMTDSGNYVYVVWSATTATDKTLQIYFAASADEGKTFNATIPTKVIDTNPTSAASTPVIAASGNYVSVGWIAGSQSFVSVSSNNGLTWTAPYVFSTSHEPQLAEVGPNVYAIGDGMTLAVSANAGALGSWTTTKLGKGAEPWIAASGTNVVAAWETKGTTSQIDVVYSTNSGAKFSSKVVLSTTTADAWAPMVNITGNTFLVAYRTNPNQSSSQEYVVVSSNAGGTWTSPIAIGIANHDNQWPFTVTASGSSIYIIWSEKVNTKNSDWQTLVSYSSDDGSTWSAPAFLSSSAIMGAQPEQDIATGAMASTGATAFAAWENNQTTTQIYFAHN